MKALWSYAKNKKPSILFLAQHWLTAASSFHICTSCKPEKNKSVVSLGPNTSWINELIIYTQHVPCEENRLQNTPQEKNKTKQNSNNARSSSSISWGTWHFDPIMPALTHGSI